MSQAQLAEAIGMARETIGAMERDQAPIELRTELAVRYRTEGVASGPRSLQTLYENAVELGKSVLAEEAMSEEDTDEMQKLIIEWMNAGGGTVGYYLLMSLSMLVSNRKNGYQYDRSDRDAHEFLAAWASLGQFII